MNPNRWIYGKKREKLYCRCSMMASEPRKIMITVMTGDTGMELVLKGKSLISCYCFRAQGILVFLWVYFAGKLERGFVA